MDFAHLRELATSTLEENFARRLEMFAEEFLHVSYGAWSDGTSFDSNDDFNYDLSVLDCVTYVEVILALGKADTGANLEEFQQNVVNFLRRMHYKDGINSFSNRNHFMCIDWTANNSWLTQDITHLIAVDHMLARALIDKGAWFAQSKICKNMSSQDLIALQNTYQAQESIVPYVTLEQMLQHKDNYFERFPEVAIINIVRPNWDLRDKIGTCLNISHLGLVFKNHQTRSYEFYHSSIIPKLSVKIDLLEYLQQYVDSPTIKGINVLAIRPGLFYGG